MAIYIKEKPNNVRELIALFFSHQMYGEYKSVETYRNKDCTQVQCVKNKYRSFENFCECVKTYFPSVSKKQILKYLLTTRINKTGVYLMSCPDIQRINLVFARSFRQEIYNICKSARKFDSKYSWEQLLHQINIFCDKDFEDFLINNDAISFEVFDNKIIKRKKVKYKRDYT